MLANVKQWSRKLHTAFSVGQSLNPACQCARNESRSSWGICENHTSAWDAQALRRNNIRESQSTRARRQQGWCSHDADLRAPRRHGNAAQIFFLNYGANIAFASLHQKELRGSIYFRNILNRKVVEKTMLSMSLIKGNKQVSVGNAFITFTIDERACSAFA